LLVLGIAASGVGLGAAAVPAPLAAIRPLVPLTYAIDAFRGAVLGSAASYGADALALGLFLVASVLVTLAVAAAAGRAPEPAGPAESVGA